ncbi:hypothetical protein [Effusibacillus dendaii]|uniref:Uncharacterized protein n=1 Tax=Effusibacillus dendaii TaxID=2743772 RepID=A0A7I8DCX1_9BACL|nr:hypothetical protein [Effusibacillus dendaii]BCJ86676.1 hypothetical protein skT53_16610 [Effusibacillus dendaii]
MAVTYEHARQFIGQPVIAHCQSGRYYGIVHRVTRDGIWLQPLPQRGVPVNGSAAEQNAVTADQPDKTDFEQVYYPYYGYGYYRPFAPLFFLPFFTLLALAPFFLW